MVRKRAPGAGRKPKGEFTGKSATITTRIQPATRAALEAAARAGGRSLSQEVEFRLKAGLKRSTKAQRRNEALAYLTTTMAEIIEQATGRTWLDDPFTSRALVNAIGYVMLRFASSTEGDIAVPPLVTEASAKMPVEWVETFCTPEGFGGLKAFNLIGEIEQAARPPKMINEWDIPIFFAAPEAVLANIGRDLGLGVKKEKQT